MPPVGAAATISRAVSEADTSTALGSGDLPVLGTPRLLAWAEEATCAALAPHLDRSSSSVGVRVRLEHSRPSPLRAVVRVLATLTEVDERQLRFEVSAEHEDGQVVARGQVTRAVVDRSRFLERLVPRS